MPDLRTFLATIPGALAMLPPGIRARHEITALQHKLDAAGRYPVLFAAQACGLDGRTTQMPLVTNLTASRELMAQALGIADHRDTARWFAAHTARAIAPTVLERAQAPVQEQVFDGKAANVLALPLTVQHELEPGPYLTAAHATTFDPESGIDNTAIQRCWVKSERSLTYFPYPASHNARNVRKFWARGEACPIALWIGHHPAVLLGSQAKLSYPESHWGAAGGVSGESLRLVPTVTHGDKLCVPADAEIVIEGFVPANVTTPDGPFGEYTGYLGGEVPAATIEVTCITRRRDAIYHDYASGLTDMLVPDNMVMEGKLYSMVKPVAPALHNVHVPASGRRFHAWLQLQSPARGEVRDALLAAMAYRRVKTVVAVDTDVDIFATESMLWALATRVQWGRDSIIVDGLSGSSLDPSLYDGAETTSKIGIDATLPRGSPPVATVPPDASQRAAELLASLDSTTWPKA
jgi:2,5-furandicarboxylate decarboxylase 1